MSRMLCRLLPVTAFTLLMAVPVAGHDGDPSGAPSLCSAGHRAVSTPVLEHDASSPEPATIQSPSESSQPATSSLTDLGGTWSKLPRSPFAAISPVALWAGDFMVTIDSASGRTATYDPAIRRWEEHQPVPGSSAVRGAFFASDPTTVWTGDEVILAGIRTEPDDQSSVVHLAFDPLAGRWRPLATSPLEGSGLLTWTDELLIEVTSDGHAAAYDPAADCWLMMPDVVPPVMAHETRTADTEWLVPATHWTGERLLAELHTSDSPGRLGIAAFDPGTWTWDAGPQGPLTSGIASAVWVEGRLLFMSRDANDLWIPNGTYDPASETWTTLDTGCRLTAGFAVWTGRLVLEPFARRAYDPATGECYRLPRHKDRSRSLRDHVWTGREHIVWSGAYGDADVAYRDGIVYRPPRRAVTDEPRPPIDKKLGEAIKARRKRGFDTDPEVVRAIVADPSCRRVGMPLTEDECADFDVRGWFSSQLEPVQRYVQRLPTHGGEWIGQRHGGRYTLALTEADPKVIARIDALMPTEPDLGWRLVIVDRPMKELRQAQMRAPRVSERIDPTAKLWSWGVDVKDGVVTLMYDPIDVKRMRANQGELEKRLGVPVRISSGRVTDL